MWKMENSPPIRKQPPSNVWICEIGRNSSLNFGEDLFFFWRSPNFGQKKPLNFGFRPKNHSEFWRRPFFFFFGDHPTLGGKKLWISELSETFRLKFRTNRLKLIQDQWKFESRSFAHFSLFQNSPPPPPFPNPGYAPERTIVDCLQSILNFFFFSKMKSIHHVL